MKTPTTAVQATVLFIAGRTFFSTHASLEYARTQERARSDLNYVSSCGGRLIRAIFVILELRLALRLGTHFLIAAVKTEVVLRNENNNMPRGKKKKKKEREDVLMQFREKN